ncbi:hypothetical protein B9Q04_13330 [Candidatus Marsarchaeota G2 archaeon BE_D]|jgi:hypothetical protein|uniref:Uncharacterized protein n=1 Tax=Candidatus Marsarchaeota G2 archaeon BE_D TaxID=1978158 RepID=A0A2R6C7Z0_9ARCH|nr:MAG: hypothetical protein B9Q04_13330 [Candidatus Marsarchaeota G2 archaeon BE_D]
MSENLAISKEVLSRLGDVKKAMESLLGREVSFDQVLVALIDVYTKGGSIEAGRIDMLIDMWEKLQSLEKRVGVLERLQTQGVEHQEVQPKAVEAAAKPLDKPRQLSQREVRSTPQVITPKPVQPATSISEKQPQSQQDSFLRFLEDVVVYPLDKIRKPREQIEKLMKENIVSIMSVGGEELLVHTPSYQAFLKKLPIPISEKQKLSQRERKLLETLSEAGLIYEDATTGLIRSV